MRTFLLSVVTFFLEIVCVIVCTRVFTCVCVYVCVCMCVQAVPRSSTNVHMTRKNNIVKKPLYLKNNKYYISILTYVENIYICIYIYIDIYNMYINAGLVSLNRKRYVYPMRRGILEQAKRTI